MARILMIKDKHHFAGEGHRVPIETVVEKLTPFEKRFFPNPPELAGAHEHESQVVVQVEEGEVNAVFPDAGYYHVPEFSAEDAAECFGIGRPH